MQSFHWKRLIKLYINRDNIDRTRFWQVEYLKDEYITSVCLGLFHSCAATKTGKLFCWGANDQGNVIVNINVNVNVNVGSIGGIFWMLAGSRADWANPITLAWHQNNWIWTESILWVRIVLLAARRDDYGGRGVVVGGAGNYNYNYNCGDYGWGRRQEL